MSSKPSQFTHPSCRELNFCDHGNTAQDDDQSDKGSKRQPFIEKQGSPQNTVHGYEKRYTQRFRWSDILNQIEEQQIGECGAQNGETKNSRENPGANGRKASGIGQTEGDQDKSRSKLLTDRQLQ